MSTKTVDFTEIYRAHAAGRPTLARITPAGFSRGMKSESMTVGYLMEDTQPGEAVEIYVSIGEADGIEIFALRVIMNHDGLPVVLAEFDGLVSAYEVPSSYRMNVMVLW